MTRFVVLLTFLSAAHLASRLEAQPPAGAPAIRVLSSARALTPQAPDTESSKTTASTGEVSEAADGSESQADALQPGQEELPEQKLAAERMKKIQQLKFDRRPSAMLQAWATPPGDADETSDTEDGKDEDDPQAVTTPAAPPNRPDDSTAAPATPTDVTPPNSAPPDGVQRALKEFDQQLKSFQRYVMLGQWTEVKSFMAELSEKESPALYRQLLTSLSSQAPVDTKQLARMTGAVTPQQQQMIQQVAQQAGGNAGRRYAEKQTISMEDVVGLIRAAPETLDDKSLALLATLLRASLATGNVLEEFLIQLRQADGELLTDRHTAIMLSGCHREIEMGEFLPTVEEAIEQDDREALNLLSQHHLALYDRDQKMTQLEQAWKVTQAALAAGYVDPKQKQAALQRAVDLAPKIREELGDVWLRESFSDRPERGKEILATIGSATATRLSQRPHDSTSRLNGLQLQKTAIDALLRAAPERAQQWRESINLLAFNWLQEAQVTDRYSKSTSIGSMIRRDRYGNIFYVDEDQEHGTRVNYNRNAPQPIEVREILETRPDGQWLALVDESMQPKYAMVFSQLYLKVNEETLAFPYIEQLSQTYPEKAKDLAHEFLRVWTRNHNPNESRDRTNYYMFMYGYERKADRIPLTRSKQERNLQELASWVDRLRQLPLDELDEQLLVRAFTTSHSTAEVYRLEAIESVFGSLARLQPETLAEMIQMMRVNLAGVWRQPDVQQQSGTKRRQQDIQLEVTRGYAVARTVLEDGLKKFPGDWHLLCAQATIMHDENDYRQELQKSPEYVARRQAAFQMFAEAARQYALAVPDMPEQEQSTKAFDHWFYAALGASDLGRVTQNTVPDLRQVDSIREALHALPGEAAQNHLDQFANALFTRMSAVNPACKFRYLRSGFKIVGDHKQAHEARKVFDYYHDLVTEIQLETQLDGSDLVGFEQPFGLFVNVRHTKEIERESGGFSKYLQNQNNSSYSYNYGRPTENYRDKFQESVTKALEEQFEVLAVTFNHAETKSRAVEPYGWRVTPYAHILLRARGPEVDRIPPLQLDLDFLDTSGYVIIPVESSAVPVDASQHHQRPFQNLSVVQTLDERQAQEGKLILEIRAQAQGLVPPLDTIVDLAPSGFETASLDDSGVSVTEFDQEAEGVEIRAERVWTVTLHAAEDVTLRPREFAFARPRGEKVKMTYQRYVDADLAEVGQVIPLEASYGKPQRRGLFATLGALAVLGIGGGLGLRYARRRQRVAAGPTGYELPTRLTPFTVLALLKEMQRHNGIPAGDMDRLTGCIHRLERHFFVQPEKTEPDLGAITQEWLDKSTA